MNKILLFILIGIASSAAKDITLKEFLEGKDFVAIYTKVDEEYKLHRLIKSSPDQDRGDIPRDLKNSAKLFLGDFDKLFVFYIVYPKDKRLKEFYSCGFISLEKSSSESYLGKIKSGDSWDTLRL